MSTDELLHFFYSVSAVKKFLEDDPAFNVNEEVDGNGYTALHLACWKGYHEIVSMFLAHPDINVNQKNNSGNTPFLRGCAHGKVEAVKVLLKDSRVDINMADYDECTPLWCASCYEHVEVIKWMIVLRGDELDLEKKGKYWKDDKECTAIEVSRDNNRPEVMSLLERFMVNPVEVRHEIRVELGLVDEDAAELFAMTVFLCDEFLKIEESTLSSETARFFKIATELPLELQMVLCYRVFGSAKENIKSKDSEAAFKYFAKRFSSSQ
jgi:hypothetical protein